MTNLFILTCARLRLEDPWQYIRQLIPQIEAEKAPLANFGIVCDGLYHGPRPAGWLIHEYDKPPGTLPGGNKLPYWHLLDKGHELGGDLIALEDDLLLSANAVRRMAAFLVPRDLTWVQFFSPQTFRDMHPYPGLWRPPRGSSLFLQAAKYPSWGLQRLVDWRRDPRFEQYQVSDQSLFLASRCLELSYGAHCPDLVQHLGEASEVTPGATLSPDWRMSQCWGGTQFDSLSLFTRDDLYR
jgi:hypothetical protein